MGMTKGAAHQTPRDINLCFQSIWMSFLGEETFRRTTGIVKNISIQKNVTFDKCIAIGDMNESLFVRFMPPLYRIRYN